MDRLNEKLKRKRKSIKKLKWRISTLEAQLKFWREYADKWADNAFEPTVFCPICAERYPDHTDLNCPHEQEVKMFRNMT